MQVQAVQVDPFASITAHHESSVGAKVGAGRYSLVRILGRGEMGIVWLARDESLHCEAALRFLPAQIRHDSDALEELRRETARTHKLTHPNIVRVHDLHGLPDEDAFLSMEYVDGRNLADLRFEQPSRVFSWQFLKPVAEQLCSALDYAHSQRIVHRNLKPTSVMLDSRGCVKLADFGLARAVSDLMGRVSMTQIGGRLIYMSPQQLAGGIPHPTDDIYSLGAIFYELLTGKPPFYASDAGDIVRQVQSVAPTPLRERLLEMDVANDVPPGVEQLIMACLSKDVADRPQSAAEASRRLREERLKLLDGGDTQRRFSASRLPGRESRKKRAWTGAILSGVVCGVAVWALAQHAQTTVRKRQADQALPILPAPMASSIASGTDTPTPVWAGARTATETDQSPSPQPGRTEAAATARQLLNAALAPVPNAERHGSFQGDPNIPLAKPKPDAGAGIALTAVSPSVLETNSAPNVAATSPTALQLLQKANTHVTTRSQNRVLQILSGRAPVAESPSRWRILFYDGKAAYNSVEVCFENGETERVYEPSRLFGLFSSGSSKTLDLQKVKIDSDEAIRIAVAECSSEDVQPKWVELKLERGDGGLPAWNVKLFGLVTGRAADDAPLGSVILLAEDGKVLKKEITTRNDKIPPRK